MEVVDKIVEFFIWLCTQSHPYIEDEPITTHQNEHVVTEEEKSILWENFFNLSEKLDELVKKLADETNPVIQNGIRKSITALKRRMTYNANKLKLM